MALTITEDWVRGRVDLKHANLEDVRSLSLPGTYHEKITNLGTGLRGFTRLKHLDISRNAIDSLQGLENQGLLEKLNLYYNNISSLQELYRLKQNQKLQEVDLRLNPVARNEPDYRLFLIHMLPNLRRLDDRAVRDNERKAALMHFSTDQAASLGEPTSRRPAAPQERPALPRTEHVKELAKPAHVVEEDDVALLDLIIRPGGEHGNLPITGSAALIPRAQEYSPESIRKMNVAGVGFWEPPSLGAATGSCGNCATRPGDNEARHEINPVESLQQRYPNIPVIVATPPSPQQMPAGGGHNQERAQRKARVQFADDANLKFQDELEAYTAYKAHGQFTPNPVPASAGNSAPSVPEIGTNPPYGGDRQFPVARAGREVLPASDANHASKMPPGGSAANDSAVYQELPSTHSVAPSSITTASSAFHAGHTLDSQQATELLDVSYEPLIQEVSDLVDRYWNGVKSLTCNKKFKVQIDRVLKNHLSSSQAGGSEQDQRLAQLEEEVARLATENMRLQERAPQAGDGGKADDFKSKPSIIRAQRDLLILRNRLQVSMDQNKLLQNRLAALELNAPSQKADDPKMEELDKIRSENDVLRQEIGTLAGRLKQSSKLQDLTDMLQDSHKSLVQTNEHLLRELEETRARHDQEMRQLHWSYDQLKKSKGYTPVVGDPGRLLNGSSKTTTSTSQS